MLLVALNNQKSAICVFTSLNTLKNNHETYSDLLFSITGLKIYNTIKIIQRNELIFFIFCKIGAL